MLSFSSCAKDATSSCYECANINDPGCEVTICGSVQMQNCTGNLLDGDSNEAIKNAYENQGYTCVEK